MNSSDDGAGSSEAGSTFAVSSLTLLLDFFGFVDTSDKSRGLAVCQEQALQVKHCNEINVNKKHRTQLQYHRL